MKSALRLPTIPANFKQAKVMVIEDQDDHWFFMRRAMEEVIPEVCAERATTAAEAVTQLKAWVNEEWELPKLILLDLYVPTRQDGLQLLQAIKTLGPGFSRIPIVMLSSSADEDEISETYDLGASSYLVKPVEFADWVSQFRELRTYWWETVTLPPLYISL